MDITRVQVNSGLIVCYAPLVSSPQRLSQISSHVFHMHDLSRNIDFYLYLATQRALIGDPLRGNNGDGDGDGIDTGIDTETRPVGNRPLSRPPSRPSSPDPGAGGSNGTNTITEPIIDTPPVLQPQPQPQPDPRPGPVPRISDITLTVASVTYAKTFYTHVFDITSESSSATDPVNYVSLAFGNLRIHLVRRERQPPMRLVLGDHLLPPRAADPRVLRVWVEELQGVFRRVCREAIRGDGTELLSGPMSLDGPWAGRMVVFRDPAGHTWEVLQNVDEDLEELYGEN